MRLSVSEAGCTKKRSGRVRWPAERAWSWTVALFVDVDTLSGLVEAGDIVIEEAGIALNDLRIGSDITFIIQLLY